MCFLMDYRKKAGIVALLDVDDMVIMGNSPDWKCIMCYGKAIAHPFLSMYL